MCGDLGLPHHLFRCKVCHFRSQHRYCSNLYPRAEIYRVCNWCLIHKDDGGATTTMTTPTSNNNSSNSSSPEHVHHSKTPTTTAKIKLNNHPTIGGPTKGCGSSPKCLQPSSPIKKLIRSPEARSPSIRKRITAGNVQPQAQEEIRLTLKKAKSSDEIMSSSNNNNNNSGNSKTNGGPGGGTGGPAVIKHVFRNKVRRYKLLDEVSC